MELTREDLHELKASIAWLDSWSGLGAIVVGMRRHGYSFGWTATSTAGRGNANSSPESFDRVGQFIEEAAGIEIVARNTHDEGPR